ncbi:thiamine-repressible mitochondrial transport protein THI74-like [Wolffia australiana]
MEEGAWRWSLGLFFIAAVAAIWIAASYIVQSVVSGGVSPFLITYICNSLFIVYIPLAEISGFLRKKKIKNKDCGPRPGDVECSNLLPEESEAISAVGGEGEERGRWDRRRIMGISLLISPFWFLAQLAFNLSLKYTTVTSNTILSCSSSLFTFLISLALLGEIFSWVKLAGVLMCMAGTVIVSLGDKRAEGTSMAARNPLLGDAMAVVSAMFYSVYVTLIRKKLPEHGVDFSMALFLGYLGLFNLLLFFPFALLLSLMKLERVQSLSLNQLGLVIGKGLLDNVLSDYLWAKAVLLTSTTVATAGLTVQVPMAAVVDTLRGHPPSLMGFLGAAAAIVGFAGINVPSDGCCAAGGAEIRSIDDDDDDDVDNNDDDDNNDPHHGAQQ